MAPFALVADMGRGVAGLTEEEAKEFHEKDLELIQQASLLLLNNGFKGEERQWSNTESGHHGTVMLVDIYSEGEYAEIDCRSLALKIYKKKEIMKEGKRSFCKNEEGKWDFDE